MLQLINNNKPTPLLFPFLQSQCLLQMRIPWILSPPFFPSPDLSSREGYTIWVIATSFNQVPQPQSSELHPNKLTFFLHSLVQATATSFNWMPQPQISELPPKRITFFQCSLIWATATPFNWVPRPQISELHPTCLPDDFPRFSNISSNVSPTVTFTNTARTSPPASKI